MTVRMISAPAAHELIWTDPDVVLVCAYELEADYQKNILDGAISLREFRRRIDSLPKNENVVFYCNCHDDEAAMEQALEAVLRGFTNVHVLRGGVHAWTTAGYGLATAAT